jgi:hypothetical protein
LGSNLGVDALLPVRLVRDRVHYQDLARQPYTPPNPGLHHRNETLTGFADPQVGVGYGRHLFPWTLAARAGLSIPLGRTEANPFELGRLGKWHQHIQFGTGTWDPLVSLAVGRTTGPIDLQLSGLGRFPTAENEHGYRAGRRYTLSLGGSSSLGKGWSANTGLQLAREEPEKWSGVIENEGNLGRTDLFLMLGGGRRLAPFGSLGASVQVPLASKTTGDQVDIPVIVSVQWSP